MTSACMRVTVEPSNHRTVGLEKGLRMLLYFIAIPVAFLVAQGFWTLIAYIVTWCGFPKAGAVVFWVSLAFTSLGAISALAAFAWTQHQLNLIAA